MRLEAVKHPRYEARLCAYAAPVGGGAQLFAWVARFRRLAHDYERLPETGAAWELRSSTPVPLGVIPKASGPGFRSRPFSSYLVAQTPRKGLEPNWTC
jgi:hypothetical protein